MSATPIAAGQSTESLCIIATSNIPIEQQINALEEIRARNAKCEAISDINSALSNAYLTHGEALETLNDIARARTAYAIALRYNPESSLANEALNRIRSQNIQPTSAPNDCTPELVSTSQEETPPYQPQTPTITPLSELPPIHGVIYQPRDYPTTTLFTATPLDIIAQDLKRISETPLNTIRIYIYYDALFHCPGNGAVPIPNAIARLDTIIQEAATNDLNVILVLNHNPDLNRYPLYNNPIHTTEQTAWITKRYSQEGTVILFDLREGGDLDYDAFGKEQVLSWLENTANIVRQEAPNHPITATWVQNPIDTAPLVDILSIHHDNSIEQLRQDIAVYQTQTTKPLLLSWIGYPLVEGDELKQRDSLYAAIQAANNNELSGWIIYNAFDHRQSNCTGIICERYGLWNTSYFPKLSLDAVITATMN